MIKLGVILLSRPEFGGTYQYSLSTLEALQYTKRFQVTIYGDPSNRDWRRWGHPVRPYVEGRLSQAAYLLSYQLGLPRNDPFREEDILLAPIYSLATLHTARPFAYTLHDLQEHHFPERFSWQQREWRHRVHKALSSRASAIICEANHVREDIVSSFGVPQERVAKLIAPPFARVRVPVTRVELEKVRSRHNLPEKFIFYPAQFWPHKNHARLVEAFKLIVSRHPDVQLALTGNKGDEYQSVVGLIGTLGLERNVRHLGYLEQADLEAIYQLATALVMPSLYESVSIPIFEAFQLGTAVAASNILSLPDQVGDAGLLFDPHSAGSIASSITAILESPDLRETLRARGHSRMQALTPELYGASLEGLLQAMRERGSQPHRQ
ncbi:glycosyltransferase family 4 protein [Bradyrhizobium sp. GCM10023182]|uniref:Glycosyltransferase family 4 protein n=1 Tax=Bradyrhizobium zhengyangense TaxID=2911009 RepID=A0ABS9LXH0_9BRAD|nr:glycosyltransferase family 1 protein [Bradyrhizobium zhengyangense]MCG2671591.1 glycosyltransferase family 4 protein [Bradyrhizobium zhengyangense]